MKKKILLLIFVICLGLGFIVGYISIKGKDNTIDEEITLKEATKIIDNFTIGYGCSNIEEYTKMDYVTDKDVSNDRAFQIVQYLEFNNDINAVSLEEVKRKIALYFGDDYSFEPEKLSQSCNLFEYNSEDKIFYKMKKLCIVNCSNTETIYKVKELDKDNGFINIYVNVLFNSQAESTYYYKDYERTELVDNTNVEEGNLYQFRFKKRGNNYQFVSCQKKVR